MKQTSLPLRLEPVQQVCSDGKKLSLVGSETATINIQAHVPLKTSRKRSYSKYMLETKPRNRAHNSMVFWYVVLCPRNVRQLMPQPARFALFRF